MLRYNHSTSFDALISILKSNILKTGRKYAKDINRDKGVISLTRSHQFASDFLGQVILTLDQSKLNSDYKIIPQGDSADSINHNRARNSASPSKAEEYIERDIVDLSKYLIKIDIYSDSLSLVPKDTIDEYMYLFKEYSMKNNVPIYIDNVLIENVKE